MRPALVRPSVRARLASSLKKAMKISSLFVFPKRRAGGRTETGASTATGRNGTERSGRRASTRGRKGTESAAVVVVRRSIHPSVQAPTPTSTGDAADADADDGRWDETTGAIVVVASRGAAWAPTTPTPTTGRRPGRRRARGGKGG